MSRRIAVVTTFSEAGWNQYAEAMVHSWVKHWPGEVDLFVYPDERVAVPTAPNVHAIYDDDHHKAKFIRNYGTKQYRGLRPEGGYNYRFDAVKFCHKPFALWHCVRHKLVPAGYTDLIWLDADTITHSPVSMEVVAKMAPKNFDIQFLGRCYKYTECGYLYFNLRGEGMKVLNEWIKFYRLGAFRDQREWHDSFLFDLARDRVSEGLKQSDLTGHLPRRKGAGHPFVNSFLGQYLDHHKGESRKAHHKPRPGDLYVDHGPNKYWDKENPHAKAPRNRTTQGQAKATPVARSDG